MRKTDQITEQSKGKQSVFCWIMNSLRKQSVLCPSHTCLLFFFFFSEARPISGSATFPTSCFFLPTERIFHASSLFAIFLNYHHLNPCLTETCICLVQTLWIPVWGRKGPKDAQVRLRIPKPAPQAGGWCGWRICSASGCQVSGRGQRCEITWVTASRGARHRTQHEQGWGDVIDTVWPQRELGAPKCYSLSL